LKKLLSILGRISISIVLLIFLFKRVDSKALMDTIKGADWRYLLLAFSIFFLSYILGIYRWKRLLNSSGVSVSFARTAISFCGGLFFNLFMPSTIGGDLIKGFDLALYTKKPKEVVSTVLIDRLGGYAGMVIITVTALLFGYRLIPEPSLLLVMAMVVLILLSAVLVLFNSFIFDKVNKFLGSGIGGSFFRALKNVHHEIYSFRGRKRVLLINLLLSLLMQASIPVIFYITALSIGLRTGLIYFFVLIPLIGAITMLPISIGGLGLRDAATIFFFSKIGVTNNVAFAISLLGFSYTLLISLMGGIVYVFTLHTRRIQYNKAK